VATILYANNPAKIEKQSVFIKNNDLYYEPEKNATHSLVMKTHKKGHPIWTTIFTVIL